VGNHPAPFHFFLPAFLNQPQERMESTAGLEGTNSLEVLALEKEAEFRAGGCLALKWSADEGFGGLRG
jgi:hypothetical protein